MVKELKGCLEEVTTLYKAESTKIDEKVEALLQIQRDRLELERHIQTERLQLESDCLDFECQKAGLQGNLYNLCQIFNNVTKNVSFCHSSRIASLRPMCQFINVDICFQADSSSSSSIRHQLCKTQHATTH